ncbi:MAG: GNAT family N-acetyltransferase [Ginsengibacter sp.]
MDQVEFKLDDQNEGMFYINDEREQIARLEIKIIGKGLLAIHTEVNPGQEGKGLAKKMFLEMVDYARKNHLTVKAYCPYVQAQFKKNPEEYSDVLAKD